MSARGGWRARAGISLIAIAGLALAGYHAVWLAQQATAAEPATAGALLYEGTMTATAALVGLLALFILWAAPVTSSSALFSFYLAALSVVVADSGRFGLLDAALEAAEVPFSAQRLVGAILMGAALATCLAAGFRWTQLFPRRLEPSDLASSTTGRIGRVLAAVAVGRAPAIGIGVAIFSLMTVALLGFRRWPALQGAIVMGVGIAMLALATLNLRASHRAGTEADRRRIFWVLEAGIVGSLLAVVAFCVEMAVHGLGVDNRIVRGLHSVMLPLALLALVLLLAVAVLYAGAIDSRLVIRKTVLYGATGFILTGAFVAIEGVTSELLVGRLGLPERAGGWLAGLAVALSFGPVKARLDRRLARVLDRESANAGPPSSTVEIDDARQVRKHER